MVIGITGGIGSGKSTIARELARRGFAVYDCDKEAKRIIAENAKVQAAIIALLGEEAFVSGCYNTAYVAQRVFAEPAKLELLNKIVHPAVKEDILQVKPDFIESAILYEAGLDQICDQVVEVDAPEAVRIARTMARDLCNEAQVRARIRSQHTFPHEKTIVLVNDGSQSIEALTAELLNRLEAHI